jgi:hypothetical protein
MRERSMTFMSPMSPNSERRAARIDGESGGARMKCTEAVAGQAALR